MSHQSALDHVILGCGHLAGVIQTSYRSELTAFWVALQVAQATNVSVRIWTDCEAVLKKFRRVAQGWTPGVNSSHCDLWVKIVLKFVNKSAMW